MADAEAEYNRETGQKRDDLRGRTQVNLFFESSTRTQSSFELAGKRLGADVMNMAIKSSSIEKGETLLDTAVTLNAMRPDILIVRHHAAGAVELLAKKVDCAVINAGDGEHEHPTQALLDALTIRRRKGRIDGPDRRDLRRHPAQPRGALQHPRLNALGAYVRVAAPSTLLPPASDRLGVEVFTRLEDALDGVDIIMMLRLQRERMTTSFVPSTREFFHFFGLDNQKLRLAKPDALIMHPGPINRGIEISSAVADHQRSLIREQVEMGVAVRMAVLRILSRNMPQRGLQ